MSLYIRRISSICIIMQSEKRYSHLNWLYEKVESLNMMIDIDTKMNNIVISRIVSSILIKVVCSSIIHV